MRGELKSRFQELYPFHECPLCKLEHVRIPHIRVTSEVNGQPVQIDFAPFELIGVVDGSARPGHHDPQADTPAHIYGMYWGPPGAQKATHASVLYMN